MGKYGSRCTQSCALNCQDSCQKSGGNCNGCKTGYYGKKHEHDKIIWHTAYSNEPRMTLGYVVHDKQLWMDVVEEIAGEPLIWPLKPYDERLYQFKDDNS